MALLDGVTFTDLAAASADDLLLPEAVRGRADVGEEKEEKRKTAGKAKQLQKEAARAMGEGEAAEVKTEGVHAAESELRQAEEGACVTDEPASAAGSAPENDLVEATETALVSGNAKEIEAKEAAIATVTVVAERAKARLQSGEDSTAEAALLESMLELQVLEADVRSSLPRLVPKSFH